MDCCIGGRAPPTAVGDKGWDPPPKDIVVGDWTALKEGVGAPNIGAACIGLNVLLLGAGAGAEFSMSKRLLFLAAAGAGATGETTGADWKSSKSSNQPRVSRHAIAYILVKCIPSSETAGAAAAGAGAGRTAATGAGAAATGSSSPKSSRFTAGALGGGGVGATAGALLLVVVFIEALREGVAVVDLLGASSQSPASYSSY